MGRCAAIGGPTRMSVTPPERWLDCTSLNAEPKKEDNFGICRLAQALTRSDFRGIQATISTLPFFNR